MKRLVVCCDGTWNRRDAGPQATNVAKTAEAVAASDRGTRQLVFYDQGVGTGGLVDRIVGGVTGHGLEKNVLDAYRFVVENHRPGDELFLFGFSRGAYTARSVVGMVRKCGVLREPDDRRLQEAYRLYRGKDHPDSPIPQAFRAEHSKETLVRFIGVWDTVGALGIPAGPLRSFNRRRHAFHDVQLSRIVDVACHALAIDERRAAFRPTLWSTKADPRQRVRQEWFPGAHSGVGGGYPAAGLSDVALAWMMDEAAAAGLAFTRGARARVRPDAAGALVDSRSGLWRLLPGGWRAIGHPAHQPQSLHASALERHLHPTLGYRPRNLAAYLARTPSAAQAPAPASMGAAGKRHGRRRRGKAAA